MTDESGAVPVKPRCPICGRDDFRKEKGKLDSAWGMTAHKVDMLICMRCGYLLLFSEGNTIFDFD
ncbi:MAG: hypothetical protein H0V73_07070 [Chloroflexi bacterium]|nr:hypothetical protein [Chloroflexota bacterium]